MNKVIPIDPMIWAKLKTPSLPEHQRISFLKSFHISINDNTGIMMTIPYHDHDLIVDPPDH